MDLFFDLLILAFFGRGELLVFHSELCHLVAGSYPKFHDSSPVMKCLKKFSSFSMLSRRSKVQAQIPSVFPLLFGEDFENSLAQIFYMPSSSVKMSWTVW